MSISQYLYTVIHIIFKYESLGERRSSKIIENQNPILNCWAGKRVKNNHIHYLYFYYFYKVYYPQFSFYQNLCIAKHVQYVYVFGEILQIDCNGHSVTNKLFKNKFLFMDLQVPIMVSHTQSQTNIFMLSLST